jgi:predicted CDP-diglyceride synthetase/phosphatidate cytidylyltransferase
MKLKQMHFGFSILSFLLGLLFYISDLTSDSTHERFDLLFFSLIIIGGYGIAKYVYDK